MIPILIASDHAGFTLKERIKKYLLKKRLAVRDLGTYSQERCDYPMYAAQLAKLVSNKKNKYGILICKSGIGNSIVANKFKGVRAALCYNVTAARLSREHNDSNVLVLGAAFVNFDLAKKIIQAWTTSEFQGGRHARRLNLIKKIESKIRG